MTVEAGTDASDEPACYDFTPTGSWLVYRVGGVGRGGGGGPGMPFLTMSGIGLDGGCGFAILVIIVMVLPNDVVHRCGFPASITAAVVRVYQNRLDAGAENELMVDLMRI